MEILVEILGGLAATLAEIFLEFVLQVLIEAVARAAANLIQPTESRTLSPALLCVAYGLVGGGCGAISAIFWPASFVHAPWARILTLVIVPVLAGLLMAGVGAWRRKRGATFNRLDLFGFAYVFAAAMAVARYLGTH